MRNLVKSLLLTILSNYLLKGFKDMFNRKSKKNKDMTAQQASKRGITLLVAAVGVFILSISLSARVIKIIDKSVCNNSTITTASYEYECTDISTETATIGNGNYHQTPVYTFTNRSPENKTCSPTIKVKGISYEQGDTLTVSCADITYPDLWNNLLVDWTKHIEIVGNADSVLQQAEKTVAECASSATILGAFPIILAMFIVVGTLISHAVSYFKIKTVLIQNGKAGLIA